LTAGYITPIAMLLANVPPALVLGVGFAIGVGAQWLLTWGLGMVKKRLPQVGEVSNG
jgi:hypothetical protein